MHAIAHPHIHNALGGWKFGAIVLQNFRAQMRLPLALAWNPPGVDVARFLFHAAPTRIRDVLGRVTPT